ncbi:Uncharacterised protein [Mycobacterium tuberculosis]|nr:Uncharacterised protein [Mycobacterium tuberculosis]
MTSVMPARPPGRRIRANCWAAAFLSGNVQNAHSHTSASNVSSGNGTDSASPRWKRTRSVRPVCATAAWARFTLISLMSTPSTATP